MCKRLNNYDEIPNDKHSIISYKMYISNKNNEITLLSCFPKLKKTNEDADS